MVSTARAFSSFSVNDLDAARAFYADILDVDARISPMGLELHLGSEPPIFVYAKDNHVPATFTVLNFGVDDVDTAVDDLVARGVTFERYEEFDQDERGVARGDLGPPIAWFTDPAGNILSVMQDQQG